jgi:nucleotide-binding universal stress UspA family protein
MKGLLSSIVVVVNGAESSIAAVKYAISMQKAYGSKVTAVYVVDTHTIRQLAHARIFIAEESAEYERELESTGRHYLAFVEELARTKGLAVETRLVRGSIASEVVRCADETGADCILLGSFERDTVFRDVIVEASREILRFAHCSVLIVRSRDAEQAFKAV